MASARAGINAGNRGCAAAVVAAAAGRARFHLRPHLMTSDKQNLSPCRPKINSAALFPEGEIALSNTDANYNYTHH